MACWNVCPAGCEDFGAVARMGGDDLDGWLGASWLYLRTLRNVETPPCAEYELDSAKPKTAAVEGDRDRAAVQSVASFAKASSKSASNHSTEIYWFARSAAAAVAMYFE